VAIEDSFEGLVNEVGREAEDYPSILIRLRNGGTAWREADVPLPELLEHKLRDLRELTLICDANPTDDDERLLNDCLAQLNLVKALIAEVEGA
jgi:hypothetical protein